MTTISPDPISTAKPRRRLALKLFLLFAFLSVIAGGAFFFAERHLIEWSTAKLSLPAPVEVELPRGASLSALSQRLEERGLVTDQRLFQIWVRFYGSYGRFQAGLYRFEGAVSPADIAGAMSRGEIYVPVVLQLTVREGATLKEVGEKLSAGGVGPIEDILRIAADRVFLDRLQVPGSTIEGFLYPATYQFSVLPTPEEALTMMVQRFWKALPPDYETRAKEKGLSLLQAVTFASLIELETALDEERPLVSEVIWNRLNKGMALGIDAALIYGIKDYKGDITWQHLKDADNPYNTRLRSGLPPTPIASPSLKSLLAVLSPSNQGYFYYVVDAETPGAHRFAKTLSEHNRNVRDYVQKIRRKRLSADN